MIYLLSIFSSVCGFQTSHVIVFRWYKEESPLGNLVPQGYFKYTKRQNEAERTKEKGKKNKMKGFPLCCTLQTLQHQEREREEMCLEKVILSSGTIARTSKTLQQIDKEKHGLLPFLGSGRHLSYVKNHPSVSLSHSPSSSTFHLALQTLWLALSSSISLHLSWKIHDCLVPYL